jgi:hypothetical protein
MCFPGLPLKESCSCVAASPSLWRYPLLSLCCRGESSTATGIPRIGANFDFNSQPRRLDETFSLPARAFVSLRNAPQTRSASASHCLKVRFILLGLHCSSCGRVGDSARLIGPWVGDHPGIAGVRGQPLTISSPEPALKAAPPVSNSTAENRHSRLAQNHKPCEEKTVIASTCL